MHPTLSCSFHHHVAYHPTPCILQLVINAYKYHAMTNLELHISHLLYAQLQKHYNLTGGAVHLG